MDTLKSYKTLDLEPGATAEQIRQAYKELREVWHTDRFVHNPTLRQKAAERMFEIEDAFQTLRQFVPGLDPLMNARMRADRSVRPEDAIDELPEADSARPRWAMGVALFFFLALVGVLGFLLLLQSKNASVVMP